MLIISMVNYQDVNEKIMEAVFSASRTFRIWMRESSGLSIVQFRVLSFISRNNNCSLLELKNYLGTSLPSTSRLVDSLSRKGLIERLENEKDRRRIKLKLTESGILVLTSARKQVLKMIEERMSRISKDDIETLSRAAEILARLVS